MKVYGIIYLIRNNVNNKIYIGQTISKNGFNGRYNRAGKGIERVYKYHKYCETNKPKSCNIHLLKAIEKYGFENFYVDEEFDVAYSKEELDKLEKYYIILWDTINNGYNCKGGGSNGNPFEGKTEEEKMAIGKQISQRQQGENNHRFGTHLSAKQKEHLSNLFSGKGNPMYGKTRNDMKGENNPMKSEEMKDKFRGENSPVKRQVICITTGKIFNTIAEGAKFYNIKNFNHISSCCRGKRKSCGKLEDGTKLKWMYLEDYKKVS